MINRRDFIRASLIGAAGIAIYRPSDTFGFPGVQGNFTSSVSLTTGEERVDMTFRALQPFSR
ncbi:MAG TPA: twin-arginine translocation signal domain-containing protein, partial [Bacteroidales bacterium]|nr:twin-arginine translocation signal domain-containing protein [Bacteroidales bacterium]